jgi:hypothetical protein
MKFHVYVSQSATYRYTVEAGDWEEAEEQVTEAICRDGFETGNYKQLRNSAWEVDEVEPVEL